MKHRIVKRVLAAAIGLSLCFTQMAPVLAAEDVGEAADAMEALSGDEVDEDSSGDAFALSDGEDASGDATGKEKSRSPGSEGSAAKDCIICPERL